MNKTDQRLYISKPKTEAGIRKIPIVKEVRNALDEIKQYQFDNGIFCKTDIDGYTDFIFLNRYGNVLMQTALDRALSRIIVAYNKNEIQGHVDIGTTMNVYAEVSDAKKKQSMETLAEKLVLF